MMLPFGQVNVGVDVHDDPLRTVKKNLNSITEANGLISLPLMGKVPRNEADEEILLVSSLVL